ncbi:uncharacterized protein LOC124643874 isoform X1 [Helicoverpa zea]|uniref:uncharacterized protein LOC124643874 isoform X1 n=1 Tax=Helicoverpa zea TaxID=7113 RepID=UPI001F567C0A|nr:uncharacterized protein LOC124643874 isoform X1 [Helicoverpa zea]
MAMFVNIFSSYISFYGYFILLCPSSLAIKVAVYHGSEMLHKILEPVYTGTIYVQQIHYDSALATTHFLVIDINDNLHVIPYSDDIILVVDEDPSSSLKMFTSNLLNLKERAFNKPLIKIKLKICTKENICISHTIYEGRLVSDATPLSQTDAFCAAEGCRVIVSLSDITIAYVLEKGTNISTSTASTATRQRQTASTAKRKLVTSRLAAPDQPETDAASETYVLERNASSVSTSTASTTTREPVTSVLAATDQPETVAASENWTATIVTVAVTSAAVLLLALITVACIRLCRARTPSQPASDRFLNRFYVNNLLRDECNAEIRERERRDAEICERERPDAEPEYDYVYNHTQRTR